MTHTRRTWKQTLFTPVRELLGMKPARRTWRQTIADASLHADVKKLITDVIKRARLWRYESADVADELIAHFHDGLDAGRSTDDLIKNFGAIKTAAKLIKRSKRRNRPLLWHAARRTVHATLALIVVYVLAAFWLSFGEPNPSVDYIAAVNKNADAVPENDRAWPIYRKAFIECDMAHTGISINTEYYEATRGMHRQPMPDDPQWEKIKPIIAKNQLLITTGLLAAEKPAMGLHMGLRRDYTGDDSIALFGPDAATPTIDPHRTRAQQLVDESVINILLPSLSNFRTICTLLSFDMAAAAEAHDGRRAVADYRAILRIARQTREVDFLICQLVSISNVSLANQTLALVLEKYPGLFTHDQLATLAHLSADAPATCRITLDAERTFFLDLVQRHYTDDGHGNGHLTRDWLVNTQQWISLTDDNSYDFERAALHSVPPSTVLPLLVLTSADRREIVDFGLKHYAEYEALAAMPMWEAIPRREAIETELAQFNSSPANKTRFRFAMDLLPAIGACTTTANMTIAFSESTAVVLALEAYRVDHGQYPNDLASLVPQYFPHTPLDHSTGKPLLYKIRDGKPLLYGRGLDGKDDGGVIEPSTPKGYYVAALPKAGDWVLFPMPTESEDKNTN